MKKLIIIVLSSVLIPQISPAQLIIRNAIISNPVFFDNFDQGYTTGNIGGQRHWAAYNNVTVSSTTHNIKCSQYEATATIRRTESFSTNQFSQITISAMVDHAYIGPAVRCNIADSTCYSYEATDDKRYLYKIDNSAGGSWSVLGSVSGVTTTSGTVLRIEIRGSEIRCYINGHLDTALTGGTGIFTDTEFTTGVPAIDFYGDYEAYADNWIGGNL
jgi:hypothetical protein